MKRREFLKKSLAGIVLGSVPLISSCTENPISPDDDLESRTKIAFTSVTGNFLKDISVINANGSNETRLTSNSGENILPSWSPYGSKIAFISNRDGDNEIYVMNADGFNQTNISQISVLKEKPSWSPDGTKIAFSSNKSGMYQIYVVNGDGSNRIRLTDGPAPNWNPVWSPDGSKVAFRSSRDDANNDIYLMDADGSNQIRLTNTLNKFSLENILNTKPTWSPDGSKIAFVALTFLGGGPELNIRSKIYVVDIDGSNLTNLSNNSHYDGAQTWSPNGSKIAFIANYFNVSKIHVMNADGSNRVRLNNINSEETSPSWSPDGSQIAFSSMLFDRDGNYEIYVMDIDGSNQTRLTNNAARDFSPTWSPYLK